MLALLLSAMTAAGPWLCCCTLPRLFAADTPAEKKQPLSQHCCHSEPQEESTCPEPTAPPCSCQDERPVPALLAAAADLAGQHALSLCLLDPFTAGPFSLAAMLPVLAAPRECIAFPFLEPADMLRALNVMRC